MIRDLKNVAHVIREVQESRKAIEDARPASKRGRPRKSENDGEDGQ